MLTLFVISNIFIVIAYTAMAVYVVPRFSSFGQSTGVHLMKAAFLLFFLMCGLTHAEYIGHALTGSPEVVASLTSEHMVMIHLAQAIAAPIGAFLAWKYVYISIGPKKMIKEILKKVEL